MEWLGTYSTNDGQDIDMDIDIDTFWWQILNGL